MKTCKQYLITPDFPLSIHVIGCGGTGSHFIMLLARMIWAYSQIYQRRRIHVVLWDGDIVSPTNISRQLFLPDEVNLNKAEALASRYNRMYGYEWIAVPEYFNEARFREIPNGNIYISFTDKVSARQSIHKCFKSQKAVSNTDDYHEKFICWIDAGNSKTKSNVFFSLLGQKTIIDHYPDIKDDETTPSCSTIAALEQQSLFINVFTADIVASLLWDAIYENKDLPNIVYFNSDFLNIKKVYENTDQQPKNNKRKQNTRIHSKSSRRGVQAAATS